MLFRSSKVAGKGTASRAKSSGGVNTPPSGKGSMPGKKMGGVTKMKSKTKLNYQNLKLTI